MNRKILNKNSRSNRMSGYSSGKIGTILGIQDKNGEWLHVGDKVLYENRVGRILYDGRIYGVAVSNRWFYDMCEIWGMNEYDIKSYEIFYALPMDNGAKMKLQLVERFDNVQND